MDDSDRATSEVPIAAAGTAAIEAVAAAPPRIYRPSTKRSRHAAAIRSRPRALIVASSMLEREMSELYAKANHGFLRSRRVNPKAN